MLVKFAEKPQALGFFKNSKPYVENRKWKICMKSQVKSGNTGPIQGE